jgi:predicted porin
LDADTPPQGVNFPRRITPSLHGLRVGVSYTPDGCEESFGSGGPGVASACGGSYGGFVPDANANQFAEVIEFGARYERTKLFDSFDLALSFGFAHSDIEAAAAGRDERQEWGIGIQLSHAAWTLGGAYRHDDQGFSAPNNDRTDYSLGLRYRPGPWGLAVNYSHIRHEDGGVTGVPGADTLDQVQLEAMYSLGPGIELQAGIIHYDFADSSNLPANENRGTFFILGTFITC